MTTVVVSGATGKTGRAVTAALLAAGAQVRALSRHPDLAVGTAPAALSTHLADLSTGHGLEQALTGAHALYLLAPNLAEDEPGMVARALDAAHRAGLDRVVYHSVAHPYAPSMPHHLDKAVAEDQVRRSGLRWTVLQPCAYTQNLLEPLRAGASELAVPYDVNTPFGLVDLVDVAQVAALVLTRDGHHGATYELGGPHLVSVADVADAASQVLRRPVTARRTDPAQWASGSGAALAPAARQRLLAMFDHYDRHGLPVGSVVATALLGRAPTSVLDVLTRELVRD